MEFESLQRRFEAVDELKTALQDAAQEIDRLTLRNKQLSEFNPHDDRIGKLIKAEETL